MPAAPNVPDGVDFDGPLYVTDAGAVMNRTLVISDNLPALRAMPDDCVDLIYLDPPFNSGADYLNPIGIPEAEARGLQYDLKMPVPGANKPYQTGFRDHFHMDEFNKDGTPNDNWKPEWVREISRVIPSLPPLSDDSREEVEVGYEILKALDLRKKGAQMVACPSCGRADVDIRKLANTVDGLLKGMETPVKVAVMGCEVNGPGEAKDADVGIAAGNGRAVIFRKGRKTRVVEEADMLSALLEEVEAVAGQPSP